MEYGTPVQRIPASEEMLMMEPPPCATMCGMTCFMVRKGPLRLMA